MQGFGGIRALFFLHSPTFFRSDNPTPRLLFHFIQQAVYNINSGYTVRDGEWSVGECVIIDLEFMIPIQP
jgi:hypothetical protein